MSDRLQRVYDALASKHWDWCYWDPLTCPPTLLAAFADYLPHIPQESWPTRFNIGGIYHNGQPLLQDQPITAPCRLEYYEPKYDIAHPERFFPAFRRAHVLYHDGELLAVFKPAGIPSYPSRDQRRFNLKAMLDAEFGAPLHMPSRLDTSVSGLVVISTSDVMHRHLQQAFEKRSVDKYYRLRVAGVVPWESMRVEGAIGLDELHPVLRKVVPTGGLPAETIFTRLAVEEFVTSHGKRITSTLLQAQPKSGRTHQIRVHAEHVGFPIIGDNFYGGEDDATLQLISYAVRLPIPNREALFEMHLPDYFTPRWAKTSKDVQSLIETEPCLGC
jgi:23S rRNA-/tRNA-specific pseudouridylate synthase